MKSTAVLSVASALVAATVALAHEGVTNSAVLARMEAMSAIQDSAEVLGAMAKGERPFEAAAAREAARAIARHAAETPALFAAREMDPESEARPVIWEDFADFEARSRDLEAAAEAAAGIAGRSELRPALARIGQACKSCHEAYRE